MGECKCEKCVNECKRVPGWFLPEEAQKAIEAGYAKRLMLSNDGGTLAISAARIEFEGKETYQAFGRCTFLTEDNLCEIHASGFKPVECRTAFNCKESEKWPTVFDLKNIWADPKANAIINLWKEKIND